MLRPTAKAVATAATALVLLSGCGGGDDTSSDAGAQGGEKSASSTPSAPQVASFDPPKTFVPSSAFGVEPTKKDNQFTFAAGMVGQTTLIAGLEGVSGRNIAAQGKAWFYPATELDTTETLDLTKPIGVQVDGKDVVAIAYIQNDKGNGTQKAKGQVVVQWIDAAEGTKVAEVIADLTPVFGAGGGADDVVSQAYDAATGQIAVGVSPINGTGNGQTAAVYADPKTQKATVIPALTPAGVLNGVIVGAKSGDGEGTANGAVVIANGATGKVTKQTPVGKDYLNPAGQGAKHAFLSGSKYGASSYENVLYSVDIATGGIVQIPAQAADSSVNFTCLGDRANAVVCTGKDNNTKVEILGVDDTTGKKTWGYTKESASRIIPDVTAAFHGIVYAQAEVQPVLMDIATGEDVKTGSSTSPSEGSTPTSSESSTPTGGSVSQGADPGSANGSDMSLFDGKMRSPVAVTQYGGTYLQDKLGSGFYTILIALTPTA